MAPDTAARRMLRAVLRVGWVLIEPFSHMRPPGPPPPPPPWDGRPTFALDADVTTYWPDVRPCYEERPNGF